MNRTTQASDARPEQRLRTHDSADQSLNFRGPWFTAKQAAAYIPCKTVKGWYRWRDRHGIVTRGNGSVAKADLDRALKVRRKTHRMHPRSLGNLQLRHRAQTLPRRSA